MNDELIGLGLKLSELTIVNTASFIGTKIKMIKEEKDIERIKKIKEIGASK